MEHVIKEGIAEQKTVCLIKLALLLSPVLIFEIEYGSGGRCSEFRKINIIYLI